MTLKSKLNKNNIFSLFSIFFNYCTYPLLGTIIIKIMEGKETLSSFHSVISNTVTIVKYDRWRRRHYVEFSRRGEDELKGERNETKRMVFRGLNKGILVFTKK
jgi:hypothetical protein